jgi:hypothetical protein
MAAFAAVGAGSAQAAVANTTQQPKAKERHMCRKCRNIIRERAITAQMDQENIPVELRAIFERGAKFGELQAALFLEKMTRSVEEETAPVLAIMSLLGGEGLDKELTSLSTMKAVYQEQFEEGSAIIFGKIGPESRDRVNVLRQIHDLPLMEVGKSGEDSKPGFEMSMAEKQRQADASESADELLSKIVASVKK